MALRFLIHPAFAVLTIGFALSLLEGSSSTQVEPTPEGRAPTRAELAPAVEAAFALESYAPRETAKLVISNRARGIRLQIFQSGPERIVTRSNLTMNGVPVTGSRSIGSSSGHRVVRVQVGAWPSGLYFARLRAADGRVGFAPFVVRPRWLGEHRVAVVLPTLTWQAYNLRDEDGDGIGDSWYARLEGEDRSARSPVPEPRRAVQLPPIRPPFLHWLARTGKDVDVLSQSDLESARSRTRPGLGVRPDRLPRAPRIRHDSGSTTSSRAIAISEET